MTTSNDRSDGAPGNRRDLAWPILNGLLDVVAGVTMLLTGSPIRWSSLVIGCGVALLVGAWTLTSKTETVIRPVTITFAIVGVAFTVLAVLYLTRDADTMPHVIPGYDADSEHWCLVPGVLSAMIAAVMVPATCASAVRVS